MSLFLRYYPYEVRKRPRLHRRHDHALPRRRKRELRSPHPSHRAPDRRRHERHSHARHDGRILHDDARGGRRRRAPHDRHGRGTRARHRRLGFQLHGHADRDEPPLRGDGRRRAPHHRPVLQQGQRRGHVPPLRQHGRRRLRALHPLQRAGPHGLLHPGLRRRAPREAPEHLRHQGSFGQHELRHRGRPLPRPRLPDVVRQRRHHGPHHERGRLGRHQRLRQHRPRLLCEDVHRLVRGPHRRSGHRAGPPPRPHERALL